MNAGFIWKRKRSGELNKSENIPLFFLNLRFDKMKSTGTTPPATTGAEGPGPAGPRPRPSDCTDCFVFYSFYIMKKGR